MAMLDPGGMVCWTNRPSTVRRTQFHVDGSSKGAAVEQGNLSFIGGILGNQRVHEAADWSSRQFKGSQVISYSDR